MEGNKEVLRVGITIGDVNGIGPEVILKSLKDNRILADFTPVIYGASKVISFYKRLLNIQDFNYVSCKSADEIQNKKINLINVWNDEFEINPGISNDLGGKYAFKSLEAATNDIASGKIDVLVTAPISKENIQKAGFQFPGHTEYLADLSGVKNALMVLVSPFLRVALVTTHLPLREISSVLSKDLVLTKIKQLENSLIKDFGIQRPRIAVFGLNPHAGENGKIGSEEQEIILPAISAAKNEGVLAYGPFAADGFFGSEIKNQFDGILAMYHDQGLAAFKALSFDDGVNFTADLPIVRTSPDHGTAFDIAGKNTASEQSFRSAIYLAIDIFNNRKFLKQVSANPLPFNLDDKQKKREDRVE